MSRKKKESKITKRRGRVGAIVPKKYAEDTNLAIGVVGGMLLARMIPGAVARMVPNASPLMVNAVQAGIGVLGAVSTKQMPLLRGASLGLAGMGLMDAVTNLGWLPNAQGVKEVAPPAAPAAATGREVLIDLDGGGAVNRLAGSMGKGYTGNFAANRLAGELGAAGILI